MDELLAAGSASELAAEAGVTPRAVKSWRAGERRPDRRRLAVLLAIAQGDDVDERRRRVELYAERVARGLEPCTGRRPPPQRAVWELEG